MKRAFFPLAIAAIATSAGASDLNEAKINALIGQYLKDHPEAIIESLQSYQLKEEAERAKKQTEAVKSIASAFQGDKHHYGAAGNPKGDVRIVEFFDYNCPACKMMFKSIDQLLLEDKKTHILFVELPIFGPTSDENAKVSMAVNAIAPDKFYRFHQAAMKTNGKINSEQMLAIAQGLGINKDKLKAEAAKDKYVKLIAKDREIAAKIQIAGTPALIVGEQFIGGALDLAQLKSEVKTAREAIKAAAKKDKGE